MNPEVADRGGTAARLQLDERIAADLDVDQSGLALLVKAPKRLREPQRPGVVRQRLAQVRNADSHVVESDKAAVRRRTLSRKSLESQTESESGDKEDATAHGRSFEKRHVRGF